MGSSQSSLSLASCIGLQEPRRALTDGLRRRRRRRADADVENRSWLLADPAAAAEPHCLPSSPGEPSAAASAVMLFVSLQDGGGGGQHGAHRQRLEVLERGISPVAARLYRFSFAEIRAATRNFHQGRELGRGALSRVYRGRIGVARRAVAIKRVEGRDPESAKAFVRELTIAGALRHQGVVPLLGFCADGDSGHGLFLVYKFVSGGSLDRHLHEHGERGRWKVMPWEARYKVAVGVARAVEYLHFGADKCVIHRDIKPSNILISSNNSPKLCDFGMATWTHGPSRPLLCKSVKGTFGYLAPEYFQHGKLSDKTDIYAFGVVLLELISGRKAIDRNRPPGDENLVLWAKPILQQGEQAMEKLVDPLIKLEPNHWNEMTQMIRTAAACISMEESRRPSINQVIAMLRGEGNCSDWSIFTSSGCLTGYGAHSHDLLEKRDMRNHLALAMLGVSETDEDDIYGR